MRFLIDENVPLMLAEALREREHDAIHIAQTSPRAGDADVLARARAEDRILVTFDDDFGRMIFHEGVEPPPGVVYMRTRPDSVPLTIARFLDALDAGPPDLRGKFFVIDQGGQARLLPLK